MLQPKKLAEYVGFTEDEVKNLCLQYDINFEDTKRWYDGYSFSNLQILFSFPENTRISLP